MYGPGMAGWQDVIRMAWRWFVTPPTTATLWKRAAVALWLTPPMMLFPLLFPLHEPSTLPAMLAEYWPMYAVFLGLPIALGAFCWGRANHVARR